MVRSGTWTVAVVTLIAPLGAAAAEDPCASFDRAVLDLADQTRDGALLLALAPHWSSGAIPTLVRRAEADAGPLGEKLLYSVGLSDQAEGLRLLHQKRLPRALAKARSVALFALGEGSESATVSAALSEASGDARFEIAQVLGKVRQPRAREILEGLAGDPDVRVRLAVAESLIGQRSARARKILLDLMHAADPEIAARAGRILSESHFSQGSMEELPSSLQTRAAVRLAAKGHKDVIAKARLDVALADHDRRATALAVLVIAPDETPASIEKAAKKALDRYGPRAALEVKMAQALLGEAAALPALEAADPAFQPGPAQVLIAFSEAGRAHAALPREQAARLVSAVARWKLDDKLWGRFVQALAVVAEDSALEMVRPRLSGAEGPALVSALTVMGQVGRKADVPAMIDTARRPLSAEVRAAAFAAAARLCPR